MTTPQIIKLVHGSQELNLRENGRFWANDFVPPATIEEPLLASGSALNQYDGSALVSKRAQDIELTFTVRCYATTDGSAKLKARILRRMLGYGGDRVNPLQIHYRANSDVAAEPLWGEYGANSRYTIVHANARITSDYVQGDMRAEVIDVVVACTIKPYFNIKRMQLGSAQGGILEDTIGTVDGRSRGLIVSEATTNKMTNQVFGNATYDTGWTTGASLSSSENTDKEFVLFGKSSAKLTRSASVDVVFRQSINVGNTNTHVLSCYAKKPDRSAVTASDARLFYNAGLTTTYTAVGNGWYRLTASVTGINASTNTGVYPFAIGKTVYVDGFQIEEKTYATPLAYGDMLGCAWTGTAHASTSTRTAARVTIPFTEVGEWTVRVVWKAPIAHTSLASAIRFFSDNNANLYGAFSNSGNTWFLYDGTNSASAAGTFSAGGIYVLYFVGGDGGLAIYVDGLSVATNASYTPPATPTDLYIGTSNSTTLHANGTFLDFAVYDYAISATEALNDYTNIAANLTGGERVGCIPWLWTKDGDGTVDNCDDSGRDDWAVVGGIPGSAPAETEFVLNPGSATYASAIWLGLNVKEYGDYARNTDQYYIEGSGTADAGGTSDASGGAHYEVSFPVAPYPSVLLSDIPKPETLTGRLNYFVRLKATTGTPSYDIYPVIVINGVNNYTPTPATKTASTTYKLCYCGQINVDLSEFDAADLSIDFQVNFNGTGTLWIDFCQIIDGPLMKIQPTFFDIPGGGAAASYFSTVTLNGRQAKVDSSNYQPVLTGDIIELRPEKLNRLYVQMGDDSGTHTISDTLTFDSIDVTPRYALL